MDCSEYNELISRLIDNDLSEEENLHLQQHLDSCTECRRLYEAMQGISDQLQADCAPVPEGFAARVTARAAAQKQVSPKKSKKYIPENWRFGNLGILVACVALIFVSVSVLQTPRRTGSDYGYLTAVSEAAAVEIAAAEDESPLLAEAAVAEAETFLTAAEAPDAATADEAPAEVFVETARSTESTGRDSLLENICADGGESRSTPDEVPDYSCERNGTVYNFYLLDGLLYWQTAGSETLTLSPMASDALEQLMAAE